MSITSTQGPVQYTIQYLPETLTVSFPFNVAADLGVADGANILVLGSDYTVSGGGYNTINQLQTGTITVLGTGANAVQVGDVITIYRNISPTQTTTFASTGIQTPLMIEQDDDKLTTLVQEIQTNFYNPFPPAGGNPQVVFLGWITAETGGIRTSIDSLSVTSIPTLSLPLVILVSITDDGEWWKLRPQQLGDPGTDVTGAFIYPLVNPNNLVWVRIG